MSMLEELERKLRVEFNDKGLLEQALRHASYAYQCNQESNEKLEFLGDAVLGLIVCEYLYHRLGDRYDEGKLAKLKSALVSKDNLLMIARRLNLAKYIQISKTTKVISESILTDALEAIIGALYLDKGLDNIKTIIIDLLFTEIDDVASQLVDYKSKLQEIVHKSFKTTPNYKLLRTSGPDHAKEFEVCVMINDEVVGYGRGRRKQDAEKEAAKEALQRLSLAK